jgi:GNAT superfamily N-acetyltransferase
VEGVRSAAADDVARIAELVTAGIDELQPTRGGEVWAARDASAPPHEPRLEAALTDPTQRLLVGTIDDVVIGYTLGRIEQLRDGTCLGVIDDIFVEEGARGVGVGEAMIGAALSWFGEAGCVGVDAVALPGHRVTKNFFEGSGFTARKIVMHHRMDERE